MEYTYIWKILYVCIYMDTYADVYHNICVYLYTHTQKLPLSSIPQNNNRC